MAVPGTARPVRRTAAPDGGRVAAPRAAVRDAAERAAEVAGRVVGGLRRGRALHTRGVCAAATLTVAWPPVRPLGVASLDRQGRTEVLVRLSKGVSLPGRLPDVLGLAIRLPDPEGDVDLLLSTAAPPPLGWLPIPRRAFTSGPYSSLARYRHRDGPLRLVAVPYGEAVPADPRLLGTALAHAPLLFQLFAQPPRGPGRPLAMLRVHTPLPETDVPFDPVENAHPGLRLPETIGRLRRGAYAGSRAARRAPHPR
ncbi:hypothetical protein [Thermostaphylospora chromogena]|uniref:Phosphodiesterase n=1 Tax=Thermostaphylospora chromogena TaxID=35622 RepID=A0A1H1A6I1_9ACTN|nr:hypothetical protein [Thermostaphylospora chromogena]SDQ35267.1 hypothetical protein SAMN04489764_0347 [Thermostaphylospora chromogena]